MNEIVCIFLLILSLTDWLHDIEKKVKIFLYLKKDFNARLNNNVHTT